MATVRISGILLSFCAVLFAQRVVVPPSFEVAAIKPSLYEPGNEVGIFETNGRISARNVTLKRCMRGAYGVPETQILGGPKWISEDRYNIEAMASGATGDHDLMLLLQTFLAERFKLSFHREQRAIPGYKLVVAKGGLKAKNSAPGSGSTGSSRRSRLDAQGYTIGQLALKLAEVMRWPVLDATEITGRFDFKLAWATNDMDAKPSPGSAPETGDLPSIFAALQEQLGLKLGSGKVPAEVLVIDSAEKPSAN